jgi:antitoxin ParD1/3/4
MNVHLTPELKKLVDDRVASGLYSSASEVVRAGLRLLEEDERWRAEIRSKIAAGVAQAKAGDLLDGDEVLQGLLLRIGEHRQKDM